MCLYFPETVILLCNNCLLLSRVLIDWMIDHFVIFYNRFYGMVVQILSSVWVWWGKWLLSALPAEVLGFDLNKPSKLVAVLRRERWDTLIVTLPHKNANLHLAREVSPLFEVLLTLHVTVPTSNIRGHFYRSRRSEIHGSTRAAWDARWEGLKCLWECAFRMSSWHNVYLTRRQLRTLL
jgi:hypothetical protein